MTIRKITSIYCIAALVLAFLATPLYAKPKEDKENKGKPQAQENVQKPKKNEPQNNKLSDSHKPDKPLKETKPAVEKSVPVARGHETQKNKEALQTKALRPEIRHRHTEQLARKNEHGLLKDLSRSLEKLSKSRWAYHPHDTRGQGNMGKVDMLDPYGHDKDSDRMELYGNRGRVIRTVPPEPEPEPEPEIPPIIEPEPEPEIPPVVEPEPEPEIPPVVEPEPEPEPEPEDPIPEFPF